MEMFKVFVEDWWNWVIEFEEFCMMFLSLFICLEKKNFNDIVM